MEYIYETHLHTMEGSACSNTLAEDYIDYMIGLGYSGIIVTDHFFNGNCAVPKDLPWDKKVELYCSGYKHAAEAAKDKGLAVFFGIEYNFDGDEYLLYGVDEDWLLSNPDIMQKDRFEVYEAVHSAGGIMVQAHPYRERGYLKAIHLTPELCDGAEIFNAGNPDWQDALGYQYANDRNFLFSAGSDIHNFSQDDMGGMSFPYPIHSIKEYVSAFLKGDGTPVFKRNVHGGNSSFNRVTDDIALTVPSRTPSLEVIWHKKANVSAQ